MKALRANGKDLHMEAAVVSRVVSLCGGLFAKSNVQLFSFLTTPSPTKHQKEEHRDEQQAES